MEFVVVSSNFNLSVSLIIRTKEAIEFISQIMGASPSHVLMQGESTHDFIEKSDVNIWMICKSYKQQTDIDTCIQAFFEQIPDYASRISNVKLRASCLLRISIVSIWGQISFSLPQNVLRLLDHLEIPIEVSIFSYGNCTDE